MANALGAGPLYGWTPTGLAERISLYSYLLWALITGTALIRPVAGQA